MTTHRWGDDWHEPADGRGGDGGTRLKKHIDGGTQSGEILDGFGMALTCCDV